jgi:hypothetical protein
VSWKPPQQVSRGRLGPKRGHQFLDLLLGPSRRPVQDLHEVAFVEHVAQLDQRGEVEAAVDQVVGDQRKPRQQPHGCGATKRRRLGEPEVVGAEREQRGKAQG